MSDLCVIASVRVKTYSWSRLWISCEDCSRRVESVSISARSSPMRVSCWCTLFPQEALAHSPLQASLDQDSRLLRQMHGVLLIGDLSLKLRERFGVVLGGRGCRFDKLADLKTQIALRLLQNVHNSTRLLLAFVKRLVELAAELFLCDVFRLQLLLVLDTTLGIVRQQFSPQSDESCCFFRRCFPELVELARVPICPQLSGSCAFCLRVEPTARLGEFADGRAQLAPQALNGDAPCKEEYVSSHVRPFPTGKRRLTLLVVFLQRLQNPTLLAFETGMAFEGAVNQRGELCSSDTVEQ